MLNVIDVPSHEAQAEADTCAAHNFAMAATVAEKISSGTPLLEAVADVAMSANEPFDSVFAAVCSLVRESTSGE